ncbi:5-formyltetrahydrofolate cyclo-ligase [Paenibacillus pini]|uniref:5-formyltetrahydrofolate cyclo-ligase n=1 Tax=Paenibacillus pini JCM 16418 TaxID=1236976 RepID=W7YBC2_9BACL|nr:5-formyltetrahydrofolate cyclo-ligase [Paenibacillus pini]GAF08120.1 5-formyltetrahydrofolate cyclo-ligase [Paenibacillus pini JCM 16418]
MNPTDSLQQKKAELRKVMASARNTASAEERFTWSKEACDHAADWLQSRSIESLLVYVPFRSELDTRPLIEWAWRQGIDVYVPRCIRETCTMNMVQLREWDELIHGAYGIAEPDPLRCQVADPDFVPEAVIVPGLAFDLLGGRLGYGSGYYDRLHEELMRLEKLGSKKSVWIGIGFDLQVLPEIPMAELDVRLHSLITENGLRSGNKEEEDGSDTF